MLLTGMMFGFGVGLAHAGDLVVFDGEPEISARTRVAQVLGVESVELEAWDLAQVRKVGVQWMGAGTYAPCTGSAVSANSIDGLMDAVESALNFMEHERAETVLAKAREAVVCQSSPVDAAVLGRIEFLAGILALRHEDKPAAWDFFVQAAVQDPSIQWDERFPPTGRAVFVGAHKEAVETQTIPVRILPHAPGGLNIDGRRIDKGSGGVALVPGRHVVQWKDGGAALDLELGADSALLFGEQLPANTLSWVRTPQGAMNLAVILEGVGQGDQIVYLTTQNGVWLREVNGQWTELRPPDGAAEAASVEKGTQSDSADARWTTRRHVVVWTGVAALWTGVLGSTLSHQSGVGLIGDMGDTHSGSSADLNEREEEWDRLADDYSQVRSRYATAIGVAAAGGLVTAFGVFAPLDGGGLVLMPGGVGWQVPLGGAR